MPAGLCFFQRATYSCCYKWQNAPESATRRESRPGIEPVAQSNLTKPEISPRHARSNKTASGSRNLEDVQVQLKFDLAHLLYHIMMTRAFPEIHMHRVTSPARILLGTSKSRTKHGTNDFQCSPSAGQAPLPPHGSQAAPRIVLTRAHPED